VTDPETESGRTLHIALADGHPLMLAGIRGALEDAGGFAVVGEVTQGKDVLPLVSRTNPDVLLLDIQIPGLDGLETLDALRTDFPHIRVIVLSVLAAFDQIQVALARGAAAYIVKTIDPADLAPAIRHAVEGTVYHVVGSPEASELTMVRAAGLTERELTIIKAVARGLSNQAIAKELWVTEQTVKFHLTNIYRKLNIANRTEAARWVYEHGLAEHQFEPRQR
jgi:two-component system nitrate/nitrite response regulator NarL